MVMQMHDALGLATYAQHACKTYRPPLFSFVTSPQVQMRLQQFSGEQLADLVTALARLRFRPRASWLADFENASQSKLVLASAGGLASTVWALAEMRHQPQVSWLYSFVLAAYGRLDSFDAGQLGVVFDALPRVSPHPNWLDEVSLLGWARARETSKAGLTL